MANRSLRTWIRNAAAVFSGPHGAVTRQAEQAGCSRETVYQHARKLEPARWAPPPGSRRRRTVSTCIRRRSRSNG